MMCLAHLPRSMTSNDKVEFIYTGVRFGGFLMVLRELHIGNDGFTTALLLLFKAGVFGCLVVCRFAICSSTVLTSLAVQTPEFLFAPLSV